MLLNIFLLIGGLLLILIGANALTDGASALAKRWGVSDMVVGLTVVAFGTSAPELTISVVSSIQGNAGIAVGNVVGSNLFNILVIIGVVALFRPIKLRQSILNNEIPLVLLSSIALFAIGCSPLFGGAKNAVVSRSDGILLILFFLIFLRYTFSQAKETGVSDSDAIEASENIKPMPLFKAIIWVVAGLGALIFGGDIFVKGASGIASGLGVSDAVIGLTIVAAGTSLPELAASLTAALKGKSGIALGNVIGSNIFNAFMVLGAAATVHPLPFGDIGTFDLTSLVAASLLFWIFGTFYHSREITRLEGGVLVLCYIGYISYLLITL